MATKIETPERVSLSPTSFGEHFLDDGCPPVYDTAKLKWLNRLFWSLNKTTPQEALRRYESSRELKNSLAIAGGERLWRAADEGRLKDFSVEITGRLPEFPSFESPVYRINQEKVVLQQGLDSEGVLTYTEYNLGFGVVIHSRGQRFLVCQFGSLRDIKSDRAVSLVYPEKNFGSWDHKWVAHPDGKPRADQFTRIVGVVL